MNKAIWIPDTRFQRNDRTSGNSSFRASHARPGAQGQETEFSLLYRPHLIPLPSKRGDFRWALAVLAFLYLLTSLAHAEKLPYSLLGGAVTYTFPRRWSLQQVSRSKKLEALQFVVLLSAPNEAKRTANVILIAEPNTEGFTAADISVKKIPKTYTLVADYPEGDSWRTVLSHIPEGKPPYAVLDRFGVTPKVRVHLRIVLPSESDESATWPATLAKDSNMVFQKLGIHLQNTVGVELQYSKGNWELLPSKEIKRNKLQRPVPPQPKPQPAPPPLQPTPQPSEFDTNGQGIPAP